MVTIRDDTNIEETLKLMSENRIFSVPVLKQDSLRGFVDIWEIFNYTNLSNKGNVDFKSPASSLLGTRKVRDDDTGGVWMLKDRESLFKPLNWTSKGIRQFLVEADGGWRLVSQSDLVRFLVDKFDKFQIGDITLKDAKIKGRNMERVESNVKTIDLLKKFESRDIDVIAITDSSGNIKATLSENDLRGLTRDRLDKRLKLPVLDFIKKQNEGSMPEMVKVRWNMRLRDIMENVSQKKVHRVFIEDDKGQVSEMISLSDILGYFWNLTRDYWHSIE